MYPPIAGIFCVRTPPALEVYIRAHRMPDNQTRRLARKIDEAYEGYLASDPSREEAVYMAFRAQADNIVCYNMLSSDTYLAHAIAARALTRLGSFQGRSRLSTWFYRLAHREVKRALSERNLDRKRHVALDANPDSDQASDNEPAAPAVNLDDPISVERILKNLPDKQREVLEMDLEGHSLEDIARKKSEPLGTIRSRYRPAKAKAKKSKRQ
jgi:RNA polymerase sigma factor (sigma-70 family)